MSDRRLTLTDLLTEGRALERLAGLDLDALRVLQGRLADADSIIKAAIRQRLRKQRQESKHRPEPVR